MERLARVAMHFFISLISKCNDPLILKDYRLMNLIGFMYKIISKVFYLRLEKVIGKIISPKQSTYVEGKKHS